MPGGQAGPARVVQRPAPAAGRPAGRSAPRTASGPSHGTLHCRLLGDARRALGLSEVELAARLGASPAAIFALEAGDGRDMPSWPETVRIVQALLGALGMDPRPVLHALQEERAAVAAATQPRSTATGQSSAVSRSPSTGSASAPSKSGLRGMMRSLRGAARRVGGLSSSTGVRLTAVSPRHIAGVLGGRRARRIWLSAAISALLVAIVSQATFIGATASTLPAPLGRFVTQAVEQLRVQFAPVREGLRWIEVEDPRTRRGDKLQTARR